MTFEFTSYYQFPIETLSTLKDSASSRRMEMFAFLKKTIPMFFLSICSRTGSKQKQWSSVTRIESKDIWQYLLL